MRPIAYVLCAAAVYPLWAADVETQHALDVTLPVRPKLDLILHSRIRTQPGGLGFYQFRAGPIVSWDPTPRITLLSGYYYAQQERKIDSDFIGGHRLFGGAEIAVAETRRWAFDQRFLTERLLSDAAPDFNRYRLRSRLGAKTPIAPYTSHEFFFDAQGWRSNRHSAGIRWSPLPAIQFDLGYLMSTAGMAWDLTGICGSPPSTLRSRHAGPILICRHDPVLEETSPDGVGG